MQPTSSVNEQTKMLPSVPRPCFWSCWRGSKAIDETGQSADALGRRIGKKLIFICSIELYGTPLKPVLKPYRKAADVIESFNLILIYHSASRLAYQQRRDRLRNYP